MKVLHIIDSAGLYGAEVMLLNLMHEQTRIGIKPILASIGDAEVGEKQIEQEASRMGLRCETFRFRPGPNFAGAFEILCFAWNEKVDILHSHGYKGNILFGFIPKVIRRLPMVSTAHGWTWTGGLSRMMVYEYLDVLALGCVDQVVVVNSAMQSHPKLQGAVRRRLTVIENGISCEELPDHNSAGVDSQIQAFCEVGVTIGAIGRLSTEKGFDLLIEAFARLVSEGMDIRLLILGEGAQRSILEDQIKRLNISERVFMPGYRLDGHLYLPYLKLFAISSLTEGLPMVLLEAMRAAVPIVSTSVGGIPEVLQDGLCGQLVEPGSVAALLTGIQQAFGNIRETSQRVKAARQRVLETYSSRTMAIKYSEVYQRVLQ